MTTYILAEAFSDSPLGAAVIGVALTALVTVAVAAVKMVMMVAAMQSSIAAMREDIDDLKENPDIMRYSDQHVVARIRPANKRPQGGRR